jgi:osmotically-inducible protein OsmY
MQLFASLYQSKKYTLSLLFCFRVLFFCPVVIVSFLNLITMANYNDRNRNRGGMNQEWDDDFRNNQGADFENDRRRYGPYSQERGNFGNSFENDKFRDQDRFRENDYNRQGSGRNYRDTDWGGNQDMYGNRGSSYTGGRSDEDWKYRNTIGPEDRGGQGFGNDRNRNENRGWWDRTRDEVSSWFGDDDAERRRRMDESEARYRGKGPKGYTRSDERIKEDVNDRLSDDNYVDASDIDVTVQNGEVTLSGTVRNRSEKRRAEDVVESISGVKNVENRIRISTDATTGTMGQNQGASSGVPYGSAGNNPTGAFDTNKRKS